MAGSRSSIRAWVACALLALSAFGLAAPASANGEFLQIDVVPGGSSVTATIRRDRVTATLGWSEFETGHATNLWLSYGFDLGSGAWLRAGPSARLDDTGRGARGVKLGIERFAMDERMTLFLLGEFNTIQREYQLLAQLGHRASGLSAGFSVQGNDAGFRERTITAGYRFGATPVSLRLGYRIRARRAFVGITVNTF